MVHTLNGQPVFGQSTVTTDGPTGSYRAQTETLPGVDGERVYRLGRGPVTWRIHGRMWAGTLRALKLQLMAAANLIDGNLYTFVDSDGSSYRNCRLTDFHPVGPIEGITFAGGGGGVTCETTGTVVWESPSIGSGRSNPWGLVPGFPTLTGGGGE